MESGTGEGTDTVLVLARTGGMVFDSLVGATLQARFSCPACGATVEAASHGTGRTILRRGFRWMTNDAVNVRRTGAGAGMAVRATERR